MRIGTPLTTVVAIAVAWLVWSSSLRGENKFGNEVRSESHIEVPTMPSAPSPPQQVDTRLLRRSVSQHYQTVGSHVIVRNLCVIPLANCSNDGSVHTISELRFSPAQSTAFHSTNITLPNIKISVVGEAGQRQRFFFPGIGDNGTDWSLCEESTIHVAHFIIGHYHLNLMHTMMRVLSIQRAVLEIQNHLHALCLKRSPRVAVLIIPRKTSDIPISAAKLGFYNDLLPILGNSEVVFWPSRDVCDVQQVQCRSSVSLSHTFVRFYESINLAPFTRASVLLLRERGLRSWVDANKKTQHRYSNSCRVVVVNRQRSRRIRNVDELKSVFFAMKTVEPRNETLSPNVVWSVEELEGRSIAKQVSVFGTADIVIAAHGAALTWSLMMGSRSALLELLPPAWSFLRKDLSMFRVFTDAAGIRDQDHLLLPLRARSGAIIYDAFSRNFSIHDKDLRKIASWVSLRCASLIA
jgi:hypothetical protein